MDGFINLNKPATWTSHDCVARVRRLLDTQKVGHGGTLDPLATGVLPIAVGRATRLLQYLPASKSYRALIRFGVTTTTDDLEGEVLTQCSAAHLQLSNVEAVLPQFVGNLSQTPPMYSAIQVGGKRLYDLARQGKTVEVPTRQITVHQLTPVEWCPGQGPEQQPELALEVDCGPGTYIRSLARDLGEAVGTGATLAQLTRTHSNGFSLSDSMTLEELAQAIAEETFMPYPAGKAVVHLAAIALSPSLARRWCMGQRLARSEPGIIEPGKIEPKNQPLRIINAVTREFLGIGEIRAVPKNLKDSEAILSDAGTALTDLSDILAPKMVFSAID